MFKFVGADIVRENKSEQANIIVQSGASLTLSDVKFKDESRTSSTQQTFIIVKTGATLIIDKGTSLLNFLVQESFDGTYGVIYNAGTLIINDGVFDGAISTNKAKKGGLIYNTGLLTINGGVFCNNTTYYGGVIYAQNGTVVINGGDFYKNGNVGDANCYQGGVLYNEKAIININGGSFFDNSSIFGAVIYSNNTVNISAGSFYNNNAVDYNKFETDKFIAGAGGVIFMANGNLNMTAGYLYGNTATTGGAIVLGRNLTNDNVSLSLNGDVQIVYNQAIGKYTPKSYIDIDSFGGFDSLDKGMLANCIFSASVLHFCA